jgi:hypothetical protein
MKDRKDKSFKIGLFWLEGDTLLATVKQELTEGITFEDGYIRPGLYHIDVWRNLHRYGMLDYQKSSRPVPFHRIPHGSIGYSTTVGAPVIFYGNWYRRELKTVICEAFSLPILETVTVRDEWFDCSEMNV